MAHLTEQDRATLAERFIDVPWCVYAQGLDQVFYCEHDDTFIRHSQTCADPFDADRALAFATQLAADVAAARTIHGVTTIPDITAYVLWHGIIWTRR